jgi:hypothetical protein
MNAHELAKLIDTIECLDFEDIEDGGLADFTPTLVDEIVDALNELKTRRAHAGDEHGIEVPS